MDYPVIKFNKLVQPSLFKGLSRALMICVPLGVVVYYLGIKQQKRLRRDLQKVVSVSDEMMHIINDNLVRDEQYN